MLLVELEVQTQPIVVVIHVEGCKLIPCEYWIPTEPQKRQCYRRCQHLQPSRTRDHNLQTGTVYPLKSGMGSVTYFARSSVQGENKERGEFESVAQEFQEPQDSAVITRLRTICQISAAVRSKREMTGLKGCTRLNTPLVLVSGKRVVPQVDLSVLSAGTEGNR